MKDLEKITEECKRKLRAINIPFDEEMTVVAQHVSNKTWGICNKTKKIIKVEPLLLDERIANFAIENVLMHELLHSCEGCMCHTGIWKVYARKVNSAYRYNIKTKNSYIQYMTKELQHEYIYRSKYVFQCLGCGTFTTKDRMCDLVRHPEEWRCCWCKGGLKRLK